MKRIVLTGGGTAGHVTPNLALIPRLKADGWEVHYIGGSPESSECKLISAVPDVKYYSVECGKLRRYFDPKNFTDPFKVIKGVFQARSIIREIGPNVVFSKGGFVSVPVVYGAAMNHVPVVVHESDMTPGLANKLSTPFAKAVCCTFPETAKAAKKGVYTGTPLRKELLQGDPDRARRNFGFHSSLPVLMVVGGSSGARAINIVVREALSRLLESFQVLHICGPGNVLDSYEGTPNYVQVEYLNEGMADAYALADIVVSRAGSNTLSELLAMRKPALLIPYPKTASRGDQILNARSMEARKLCMVLMQEKLNADTLTSQVVELYRNRGALFEEMEKEPSVNGVENVLEQIYKHALKEK